MLSITKTAEFEAWFRSLRDEGVKARINVRIRRLEMGNPGVVEPVGGGVSEMEIDYGPGYRVYYKQIGNEVVLVLYGGDKSTQGKDIKRSIMLAGETK